MRLPELATLYLVAGLGAATTSLVRRDLSAREKLLDAALLALFWPLYAPFLLSAGGRAPAAAGTTADAVARARGTALSALLPDDATVALLAQRIDRARSRIAEIDALLARPDLSESAALEQAAALESRGGARAAALVRKRTRSIRRLHEQRATLQQQLDEVNELLVQLGIQAEVVRIADAPELQDDALEGELKARLQALDELLNERLA